MHDDRMNARERATGESIKAFTAAHPGWAYEAGGLERRFTTGDFGEALAFAVRLGMIAERRNHHPELKVGWGKLEVRWTTHDAGGVTGLDFELAESTDAIASAYVRA